MPNHSTRFTLLGIRRAPRFSPHSEARDARIFSLVVKALERKDFKIESVDEDELAVIPPVTAIFSMARSTRVLELLETSNTPIINAPKGVRYSTRTVLAELFDAVGIPQPATLCGKANALKSLFDARPLQYPFWIKRDAGSGAQTKSDVRYVENEDAWNACLQTWSNTSTANYVLSEHVTGDLIKFYGVAGTDFFFHSYATTKGAFSKFGLETHNGAPSYYAFNPTQLKANADIAARMCGFIVYGGDAIVTPEGEALLIDFNDWPSFAPCAEAAAEAIADVIENAALNSQ